MRRTDDNHAADVGRALGASRVIAIPGLPSGGPLDLIQLRADVAERLRSAGGRPTDPNWSVQRLVPFRKERWHQIEELAEQLGSGGRRVSAGQLAAILIERTVDTIPESDHQT